MEIREFRKNLFDKALNYGFSDCELYYVNNNGFTVRVFEGEVSEYQNSVAKGLSFRGTFKGKMGYAYTEFIDESIIDFLVTGAAENSEIIEDADIERLYKGDEVYPEVNCFSPELENIQAEKKIEKIMELEKEAFALDERVKAVDYCTLGTQLSEVYIANTLGLEQSNKSNMAYMFALPRVSQDGAVKVAGEEKFVRNFEELDTHALAKTAVELAVSYLGASQVPSGAYKVMFTNNAFINLLQTFGNSFYAERVQKGLSLLKDKQDTEIASEKITLRDDGICTVSIANTPFDSEGVATKNKVVVEKGILKTLLYNLKSAEKDGVKSTGNGFKPGFRDAVTTGFTSFYAVPDEKLTRDDLIAEMQNGLIISDLQGLHSGANQISGDFSLSAQGHLIEDGKVTKPVEQITIAGNFFQLLKDVCAVGNDLRFEYGGIGAVGSPSVLVSKINVAGE